MVRLIRTPVMTTTRPDSHAHTGTRTPVCTPGSHRLMWQELTGTGQLLARLRFAFGKSHLAYDWLWAHETRNRSDRLFLRPSSRDWLTPACRQWRDSFRRVTRIILTPLFFLLFQSLNIIKEGKKRVGDFGNWSIEKYGVHWFVDEDFLALSPRHAPIFSIIIIIL